MTIEGKKIEFARVSVNDALKIKNAMMIIAKDNVSNNDMMDALMLIDDIAVKYLIIDKQSINTISALEKIFENEFAILQITQAFQEKIKAFLVSLPTYPEHKNK